MSRDAAEGRFVRVVWQSGTSGVSKGLKRSGSFVVLWWRSLLVGMVDGAGVAN